MGFGVDPRGDLEATDLRVGQRPRQRLSVLTGAFSWLISGSS
jgi:hypothetical protein